MSVITELPNNLENPLEVKNNKKKNSPSFLSPQEAKGQIKNIREQEEWDRIFESYEKYEGIDTFKKIVSDLPQNKKDFLFILIQEGKLQLYIDDMLWWELPPDKEILDFIFQREEGEFLNYIKRVDLSNKTLQELNGLSQKLEEFLNKSLIDTEDEKMILTEKFYDINRIIKLNKIKKEEADIQWIEEWLRENQLKE